MSTLEGIDAVLADRLRELGMDYVADVLEGKQQPSASQAMFLQHGYAMFLLHPHTGTLLIGGARDGERVGFNPDQTRKIQLPCPMSRNGIVSIQAYRAERLAVLDRQFWFYVERSMEIEEAIERLFTNYRSPNSVEQA